MTHLLPTEQVVCISQQWPCRDLQIRQLCSLLSPSLPSPPTIIVNGIEATGKSTVLRTVLSSLDLRHAIVNCAECITGRHLLTKILTATLSVLGCSNEWEKYGKGKCEHVSSLAVLLQDILAGCNVNGVEKFVLVLEGIDRQRDTSPLLLPALARLGELISSLSVVLVMNAAPKPLLLSTTGVPHVYFPPYTRKDAIAILLDAYPPPSKPQLPPETTARLYQPFITAVYDSLIGPTAGTIPSFKSTSERLWPRFVAPIVKGDKAPGGRVEWDFQRLLVKNRALFQQQGESALVHHIVPDEATSATTASLLSTISSQPATNAPSPLPSLPYFPTLILTSAYVASHTPPRLDTIFFSKYSSSSLSARNKRSHHRRRLKLLSQARADDSRDQDVSSTPNKKSKRPRTKITKSTLTSAFASSTAAISAGQAGDPSTILTARSFPLERLLAIYRAIDPNPPMNPVSAPATADMIYAELATLQRLRLVVPATGVGGSGTAGGGGTGTTADAGERWRVNVSGDWIGEMAKEIGVEVGEWLVGGLD